MASPANDELTLEIRRVIAAPARLVFDAWSDPAHVRAWFGPADWPLTTCEMDFRPGGRYRFQMTGPGGELGPVFGGTYHEIVDGERIVYDNAFEATPDDKMLVTVTFLERDGATTLVHHTRFANAAMRDLHVGGGFEHGTNIAFDQLTALVATWAR